MRAQRLMFVVLTAVLAGSITFAQPGRGGSQWLTALADAQRTSWVRTDDKISVTALSKPGFEQQWKVKLDNQPRGAHGLTQGVTASGVTLFVPMSIVAGSSNNVYGIDNDLGYVVWQRHFDAALPAATAACTGGITSAATRIVRLDSPTAAGAAGFGGGRGRGIVGYRSLLGEPGEGVPAEGRAAGPGRAGDPPDPRRPAGEAHLRASSRAPLAARHGVRLRRHRPPRRVRLSSASPARRGGKRMPTLTLFSFGHPVSAMSCRATACCTWSVLPPARTFSAPRRSCPRTRGGPRRWRWARRSTRRHRASAAAPRTACGRSIWTARRSRSCRGRRTAGEWSGPSRSRRTARSSRRSVPGRRPAMARRTRSSPSIRRRCR